MKRTMFQTALELAEWGWCIVPVPHGQKSPTIAWKGYQQHPPKDCELHQWFDPGNVGMAVVCGQVSSNLIALDFDTVGSYDQWKTANPDLAATLPTDTRGDSGRYHVLARTVAPVPSCDLYLEGFEGKAGEILSNGKLCVLPPTRHPDGSERRWIVPPYEKLPFLTLEQLGVSAGTVRNADEPREHIIKDVIGEGERHGRLTQLAAKLRGQGHTTGFILNILSCVNDARCVPPVPSREIEEIARWAGNLPHSSLRAGGDDEQPDGIASSYDPSFRVSEQLFTALPDYLDRQPEEIAWTVEGLLPQDYLVVLGATSKAGKSCVATAIGMAVATGEPFAGMPTVQGSVLWVALEENETERAMILREFDARPGGFYVTHAKIEIDTAEGLAALTHWVRKTDAKLIVIDPLYGATRVESLSDGRKARDVLTGLKELCRVEKVCCVLLHHLTKRVESGMTRERMADSNQILASCSMDILMDAEELADGSRKLRLQGRGRGAFANQTWNLRSTGVAHFELVSAGTTAAADMEAKDAKVFECLAAQPDGMTSDVVAQATGIHLPTLRNRLTQLVREGKIQTVGKFGKSLLYAMPTPAEPALKLEA